MGKKEGRMGKFGLSQIDVVLHCLDLVRGFGALVDGMLAELTDEAHLCLEDRLVVLVGVGHADAQGEDVLLDHFLRLRVLERLLDSR